MGSAGRERSGIQSAVGDQLVIRVTLGDNVEREVHVDPRSLTLMERRLIKQQLATLGYEADEVDVLAGSIWVVMRREDAAITYDEVCEAIQFEDLQDPTPVEPAEQDVTDPS